MIHVQPKGNYAFTLFMEYLCVYIVLKSWAELKCFEQGIQRMKPNTHRVGTPLKHHIWHIAKSARLIFSVNPTYIRDTIQNVTYVCHIVYRTQTTETKKRHIYKIKQIS